MPSLRHSSATLSSPRSPAITMRTFSSAEYNRRVARLISRTAFSASSDCVSAFDLISAPFAVKMSHKPSLPQSLETVQLVLTGNTLPFTHCHMVSLFVESLLLVPSRSRQRFQACPLLGSYRSRGSPDACVLTRFKSLIDEGGVVEVDGRQSIFFAPIVLGVLPLRLIAAPRQQVHGAHEIARIEVLGVDPRR